MCLTPLTYGPLWCREGGDGPLWCRELQQAATENHSEAYVREINGTTAGSK